jgi:hypothetical protein
MGRAVPVRASGVRTNRTAEGLRIDLERRRPWWRYFAPAWILFVMTLGVVFMVTGEGPPENSGDDWFFVVWVGVAVVLATNQLWLLVHREYLLVGAQAVTHARGLGPLWRRRAYERSAIEDVRVGERQVTAFDPRTQWLTPGAVAFDYGNRTVHVADVDSAEAKRIVAALRAELGQA